MNDGGGEDPEREEWEKLLKVWEGELRHRRGADYRLEAALAVSTCLSAMGKHEEALAKLDEFAPKRPSPALMGAWLNGRAYQLTMLGRAEAALSHLEDAVVLADEETPAGRSLAGCIAGTRGIAMLRLGRLAEAETLLQQALEIGSSAVAAEDWENGPVSQQERFLESERWYWLAEVAERQGQAEEAERRLKRAAEARGPYANRAAAQLAERGRER